MAEVTTARHGSILVVTIDRPQALFRHLADLRRIEAHPDLLDFLALRPELQELFEIAGPVARRDDDRHRGLLRHAPQLQREGHVPVHVHVRVERVALEDHRDVAIPRRQVDDAATADADVAGSDVLQAGDHPQRRSLPAARRSDQDDEFLVLDRQVDSGDGPGIPEFLFDPLEVDVGLLETPPAGGR